MMNLDVPKTIYFDDSREKESTVMDIMGQTVTTMLIIAK
jgi:hypothetical protein